MICSLSFNQLLCLTAPPEKKREPKRSCVFYCGRTETALIFIFHTGWQTTPPPLRRSLAVLVHKKIAKKRNSEDERRNLTNPALRCAWDNRLWIVKRTQRCFKNKSVAQSALLRLVSVSLLEQIVIKIQAVVWLFRKVQSAITSAWNTLRRFWGKQLAERWPARRWNDRHGLWPRRTPLTLTSCSCPLGPEDEVNMKMDDLHTQFCTKRKREKKKGAKLTPSLITVKAPK